MTNNFKIGDVVITDTEEGEPYGITNKYGVYKVRGIYRDGKSIEIEVLEHQKEQKGYNKYTNTVWVVDAKYFKLKQEVTLVNGVEYV